MSKKITFIVYFQKGRQANRKNLLLLSLPLTRSNRTIYEIQVMERASELHKSTSISYLKRTDDQRTLLYGDKQNLTCFPTVPHSCQCRTDRRPGRDDLIR